MLMTYKGYMEKISTIKEQIDNRNNIKYLIDYTEENHL